MLPIFVTVVSGQWKVVSPEERNLDWRVKSKAQRIKIESPAGMNSEIFTNVYTKKGSHSSLFWLIFQLDTEMKFQIIENMP